MSDLQTLIKTWETNINRCLEGYIEPEEKTEDYDGYDYDPNYYNRIIEAEEIEQKLGKVDKSLDAAVLDSRVQKAVMQLVKKLLDDDPKNNLRFITETPWKWLNQLLTTARLKELAQVHVVKKGRRSGMGYDITELITSFYGKQILKNMNYNVSRKRVVNKEEYELIVATCAKIKLKLPEVIQATTTEKFFNPETE